MFKILILAHVTTRNNHDSHWVPSGDLVVHTLQETLERGTPEPWNCSIGYEK